MISGLWLPIITPFKDGAVDFSSYERLIEYYLGLGVDGLFPLGTTGESPALDEAEIDELVERTVAKVAGSVAESLELLARKPADFSVLTGEDALYFTMRANGADGGILAASHVLTERFVEVGRRFAVNDLAGARAAWAPLAAFVPLLFAEANPMPIKYLLWRQGLIASPECRLPLTLISDSLARRLEEAFMEKQAA